MRSAVFAALAVFGFGAVASAQNVQNFKPAVGTWNYFSVEGARTARHLELVPSLILSYANSPLTVRDPDGNVTTRLVEHLAAANLTLAFGLFDRLELAVDMPFAYIAGDENLAAGANFGSNGVVVGDLRVIPKIRLFGLSKEDKGKGFGAAISIPLELPTGDPDRYFGSDQVVVNPKLILEGRSHLVSFAANGGLRFRPDTEKVGTLDIGNEITYGAGLGIGLGTEKVVLLAEVFGASPVQSIRDDSKSSPIEGLGGLRFFFTPGATLTAGAGAGIVADYGSPVWRGVVSFAWHDQRYDADKDGIMDDDDRCPNDPEDKDDFQDADGCPDPDNDKDGVLDIDDQCPLDPEDRDGFEDLDGCPDPDNDRDGILDVNDQCPDEPEDKDGFEDTNGCPDPDNDGDGLLDANDKCPNEPEDKDGFQDEDGCPDPDNDGDGILDVNDKCPMVAETKNGFEDDDGCPDQILKVKVTDRSIETPTIYFDTNKAKIKAASFSVLDDVVIVMNSRTDIAVLSIEGHTDAQGNDKKNQKLSEARAASVRTYLMDKGIAPERLESKGFGESVPIDDNRTKAGRERNRRVEFNITWKQ